MQTRRATFGDSQAMPYSPGAASAAVESMLEAVLDTLPVGVLIFQAGGGDTPVCLSANATFAGWARYSENQAIGLTLQRIRFLNENPRISVAVEELLADAGATAREIDWSVAESPRQRHFSAHVSRLPSDAGQPPRVVVAVRDRTPEIQAERNLRKTMLTDALTGLPNRVLFTEQVEEAIDGNAEANIGVIILNLDRFKRINDNLGHIVGDELLITVASRLLPCVRSNDCVARLSGDEFAILVRGVESPEDVRCVVARIQKAMEAQFAISGGEYVVSASMGVATTLSSPRFAEDLIRDADFALNTAKSRGRGGVELYQPTAHGVARDLFKLEADLRKAIERDELSLVYQPLVSLDGFRLVGFEALARWHHPERGNVSPADFIPLAEDTGLILPIGRWVAETACRQLVDWRTQHGKAAEQVTIGFNVSGIQLKGDDVVDLMRNLLERFALPGNALKIELTESAVVENPELAKATFARLKALDCSIAMDDFGTGYSSLSYLQTLPIDILKIDRSFVMGMMDSQDSYKIVRAVQSLAENLGMTTVAEGVETIEQAETLRALGCQVGQGYYFARPLSVEAAGELLAKGDANGRIVG